MPLLILGLNHTTAPVDIREQVVFSGDELARALQATTAVDGIAEGVLLSTCNRTEFYFAGEPRGLDAAQDWLLAHRPLGADVANALFRRDGDAAVRHIFRVACGLESMVLGEAQILGQLKQAFRDATAAGTVGPELNRLMQHAFAVAKKIRTDTEIGASPVSVASAAVSLANQFFAGFEKHTALLVGAGATIELVAKHLAARNIGRLFVANRNLDRARELASVHGGFAVPLSEIGGTLPDADIIISSTAATEPVIGVDAVRTAIKARRHRPMFAVDIAVPRDFEDGVQDIEDVFLYRIDDLERVIQEGQGNREAAAVEADRILDDELDRYRNVERMKQAVPLIAAVREQSEQLRDAVTEEARRRLARGASPDEAIEYATAALMKKLLHEPSIVLRRAGEDDDTELLDAGRKLFGLEPQD